MATRPSTSPTKGRKSNASNANTSSNVKRNSAYYEQQKGINQPNIDVTHYKITVDTLTSRCAVVDDQKHEIDQLKQNLNQRDQTIDALTQENVGLKA